MHWGNRAEKIHAICLSPISCHPICNSIHYVSREQNYSNGLKIYFSSVRHTQVKGKAVKFITEVLTILRGHTSCEPELALNIERR